MSINKEPRWNYLNALIVKKSSLIRKVNKRIKSFQIYIAGVVSLLEQQEDINLPFQVTELLSRTYFNIRCLLSSRRGG